MSLALPHLAPAENRLAARKPAFVAQLPPAPAVAYWLVRVCAETRRHHHGPSAMSVPFYCLQRRLVPRPQDLPERCPCPAQLRTAVITQENDVAKPI